MGRVYPFHPLRGSGTHFTTVPNRKPPGRFELPTPSLRVSGSEETEVDVSDVAPTTVYKFYGEDDELLYIGITGTGLRRIGQHRRNAEFWSKSTRIELEHFDTRTDALDRERELIRSLKPPFNTIHNPDSARWVADEIEFEIPETYVSLNEIADLYRVPVASVEKDYASGRLGPPAGYLGEVPVWDMYALERRLIEKTREEKSSQERGEYPPDTPMEVESA